MINKLKRSIALVVLGLILLLPVNVSAAEISKVQDVNSFTNLLATHNVTVTGSDAEMTDYEIAGFTNMFNKATTSVNKKYDRILSDNTDKIKVTPVEILELHYFSLTSEEQDKFLSDITAQKVDISKKDDVILISYNTDTISSLATTKYTSSRTGTIRLQDAYTGNWGSAEIKLTGYFTKTTSGKKWTIVNNEGDYDVSESSSSPVQILSNTIYVGYGYEGSGTYIGNEINCQSYAQVVCGSNVSSLRVYVYPNSTYNYAKIGD